MAFCASKPIDNMGWCKTTPFEQNMHILQQQVPGATSMGPLTHNFVQPRRDMPMPPVHMQATAMPELPPPYNAAADPQLRQNMPPGPAYAGAAGWRQEIYTQVPIDRQGMQYAPQGTMCYSGPDPKYQPNLYPGFNTMDNTTILQNAVKGYVNKTLNDQLAPKFNPYPSQNVINLDNPVKSTIQAWEQACFADVINKLR